MARRYIRRVSKVKNDDTKGYIINSTNVEDKEKNTYSANVIDKFNTYSTEEQIIGYWIDGKPIYRKVVDLGLIPSTGTITSYTIGANIKNLIDCNVKLMNETTCSLAPLEMDGGIYVKINVYSKNSLINIDLIRTSIGNFTDRNLIVTVEYTKTTS